MQKENRLGTANVKGLLFSLAVPAIIGQLVSLLYNIVDRIYIGHIPEIGGDALTGVGVTAPLLIIISAFSVLIGMGGAPRASIRMGEKDNKGAEAIMGNCFVTLIVASVILTALFLAFNEKLLIAFGASERTLPYALEYMKIYTLGTIFIQLAGLNTSKEAQIKISLQDLESQKFVIQDTRPITLMSKYDIQWVSTEGTETYYENILAWVTPEAPEIKELLRYSIDTLSYWSDGIINEIVGYQNIAGLTPEEITYYQAIAIFATMADTYGVRYNATPVTTSGNGAQQRVALPEDVLKDRSGLCIETTVTMASAIQATGMHPLILILPGHSQVAVETWYNSGEYFLIETTALTADNWDDIIVYLTPDEWTNYLGNQQAIAIDMELADTIGIKPMK